METMNKYPVIDSVLKVKNYKNVLLIGGSGSGKTFCLRQSINCLMNNYSSEKIQFLIHDSKKVDYYDLKDSIYLVSNISNDSNVDLFVSNTDKLKYLNDKDDKITVIVIDEIACLCFKVKNFYEIIADIIKYHSNVYFYIALQQPQLLSAEIINLFDTIWISDDVGNKEIMFIKNKKKEK